MRAYRLKQPRAAKQRMGPALDLSRACAGCRSPLAWTNQSGWCVKCSQRRYMPRTLPSAKRGWFTDGGGI
jgi:hypothetical protein